MAFQKKPKIYSKLGPRTRRRFPTNIMCTLCMEFVAFLRRRTCTVNFNRRKMSYLKTNPNAEWNVREFTLTIVWDKSSSSLGHPAKEINKIYIISKLKVLRFKMPSKFLFSIDLTIFFFRILRFIMETC